MKARQELSQTVKNEKMDKIKEKTAILRIILMQLMTTEQIAKLPKNSIIKIMIDKIPDGSDLQNRLFKNNPINDLSKEKKDALHAIVKHSEKIIEEIMLDVCTNLKLEDDKLDEYSEILDAMQKAITDGDPKKIDEIKSRATKFDYHLGLIAKNIRKLGAFAITMSISFLLTTPLTFLAAAVSYGVIDTIADKLNAKSSLMLYSNPLSEAVIKGKNSLRDKDIVYQTATIIKEKYDALIKASDQLTIGDLKEKVNSVGKTLICLMTTQQLQEHKPERPFINAIINKIPVKSELHNRLFENNPINGLNKDELKGLQPIVKYGQNILEEIVSDIFCYNQYDKIGEYCQILDAIQEAVAHGNTEEINKIITDKGRGSTKFDYYLSVIADSIYVMASVASSLLIIPGLHWLAKEAVTMTTGAIASKLSAKSSLMLHSNPLHEAVEKGKISLKEAKNANQVYGTILGQAKKRGNEISHELDNDLKATGSKKNKSKI